MAIENIEQLRNKILESLEDLANGDIEVDRAGIIAKHGETIMSSLKLQLAYANMLGQTPNIKFLQDCHHTQGIEHEG